MKKNIKLLALFIVLGSTIAPIFGDDEPKKKITIPLWKEYVNKWTDASAAMKSLVFNAAPYSLVSMVPAYGAYSLTKNLLLPWLQMAYDPKFVQKTSLFAGLAAFSFIMKYGLNEAYENTKEDIDLRKATRNMDENCDQIETSYEEAASYLTNRSYFNSMLYLIQNKMSEDADKRKKGFIFASSPGTGKTTDARMIAAVYDILLEFYTNTIKTLQKEAMNKAGITNKEDLEKILKKSSTDPRKNSYEKIYKVLNKEQFSNNNFYNKFMEDYRGGLLNKRGKEIIKSLFWEIVPTSITSMYVGKSEKQAEKMFEAINEKAKKEDKPLLVFMDEIDSLGGQRGSGEESKHDNNVVNMLLRLIPKLNKNVIFVGATNRPSVIERALIENESRLFDQYHFLPNKNRILHRIRGKNQNSNEMDESEVASFLVGINAGQIESVFSKIPKNMNLFEETYLSFESPDLENKFEGKNRLLFRLEKVKPLETYQAIISDKESNDKKIFKLICTINADTTQSFTAFNSKLESSDDSNKAIHIMGALNRTFRGNIIFINKFLEFITDIDKIINKEIKLLDPKKDKLKIKETKENIISGFVRDFTWDLDKNKDKYLILGMYDLLYACFDEFAAIERYSDLIEERSNDHKIGMTFFKNTEEKTTKNKNSKEKETYKKYSSHEDSLKIMRDELVKQLKIVDLISSDADLMNIFSGTEPIANLKKEKINPRKEEIKQPKKSKDELLLDLMARSKKINRKYAALDAWKNVPRKKNPLTEEQNNTIKQKVKSFFGKVPDFFTNKPKEKKSGITPQPVKEARKNLLFGIKYSAKKYKENQSVALPQVQINNNPAAGNHDLRNYG